MERGDCELSEEELEALENFVNNYKKRASSAYDKLGCLRKIVTEYSPENFDITEPTASAVAEISHNISAEIDNGDTEKSYLKDFKAFLRDYRKGEFKELRDTFVVTPTSDTSKVEPHMIFSREEWEELISSAEHSRLKAFISLCYCCACTPGELLRCKISSVDLQEKEIFIEGNKQHRDANIWMQSLAVRHLRDYLKFHPGVDDIYETNEDMPLWVKKSNIPCKNCDNARRKCNKEGCGDYEEQVIEIGYGTIYKEWRKAVEKSSIERKVQMKYARKSMLTRLVQHESGDGKLRKLARWKRGSNQSEHYVALKDKDLNDWLKQTFGDERAEDTENNDVECHNCGAINPPSRQECRRCYSYLSFEDKADIEEAKDVADSLASFPVEEIKETLKAEVLEELQS
jgi:integrase/ribosomal protein L40E